MLNFVFIMLLYVLLFRISNNDQSESDNDEEGLKKKFCQGSLVVKFPWFKTNENKERDIQFYSALNDSDFLTDDENDSFEYVCIH